MAFTNSPLVSFTQISPYRSSRNGQKIDTITIHCVAAQAAIETLGRLFQTKEASSNYGVGSDGRIGMYVEEKDRSWASSNGDNDRRAVTIEVASDNTHPYAINAKAYAALIDLVTDICRRNGIYPLKWSTNKMERVYHLNGCNMTVHRDYANKACPGDYIYNRLGQIASEVNERLEEENMVRYKTLDDIPKGYRPETKELMELGFNGKGGDAGLDVTEDMLRTMIVNLRMCKAMIAALPEQTVNKEALFAEFKKNLKLNISVE